MVVIPVLAALHQHLPKEVKDRERAHSILREYVWRAFFSGRYEFSSTSKALRDFRVIRNAFEGDVDRPRAEIFDPVVCPVASVEEVVRAGSPRRKDTLARAIMLLTLKSAVNLEDGSRITRDDLEKWDYRSIVPENLISKFGGALKDVGSNAVNCVLNAPIPRADRSDAEIIPLAAYLSAGQISMTVSEDRIKSHLIPLPELRELIALSRGGNVDSEACSRSCAVFLERRAGMIHEQMMKVVSV